MEKVPLYLPSSPHRGDGGGAERRLPGKANFAPEAGGQTVVGIRQFQPPRNEGAQEVPVRNCNLHR